MIEVEVHQQLRALLRSQGGNTWPHHLTVARLVARALRLQRNTLMQVNSASAYQGMHRLSYLASLLLWPGPVILVASATVQQTLCHIELPRLRDWLGLSKPMYATTQWPAPDFNGIVLLTPQDWLSGHLNHPDGLPKIPLVIDGADQLEDWTRTHQTQTLSAQNWDHLMWVYPDAISFIRDTRAKLTHTLFQHPPNPYGCVIVDQAERTLLGQMIQQLHTDYPQPSPPQWQNFVTTISDENTMTWAELDRTQGSFALSLAPIEVASVLTPLWQNRTTILLSGTLDLDAQSEWFRMQVGLSDVTCVQFATDRHNEALTLYLPDGIPMPNTPEFAPALIEQLYRLLTLRRLPETFSAETFSVLVIDDLPLKTRIAAQLAAEFGSRVKVEREDCESGHILITGWRFWQRYQAQLPHPQLLAIATLPFPSLEDPRVASRVAFYKQQRQDWFRLYLLPEALRILQQAIAPLRLQTSILALLDNRVLHRTYGQQVLSVLSPYARLNYLEGLVCTSPTVRYDLEAMDPN